MRALGGSVQLWSEPGVGTRVSIRLPRTASGAEGFLDPPDHGSLETRALDAGT